MSSRQLPFVWNVYKIQNVIRRLTFTTCNEKIKYVQNDHKINFWIPELGSSVENTTDKGIDKSLFTEEDSVCINGDDDNLPTVINLEQGESSYGDKWPKQPV